jgi:HPt (histidine-containing phosphotransfer) domain-containing protein
MDSTGSILVEIDRDFMPVVPGFLEMRHTECALLEGLLVDGNLAEIRLLAHRMKGSGGSYGFDEISEIGEALEKAAQSQDADGILEAIARLKGYLSRITVVYI